MALRRARHVDRPGHLEEPALVVERMHLRRVDKAAGRLVGDDRVVVPAIPQPLDDIDEFVGPLVAQLVLHVRVAAEVERRLRLRTGDHVPGGAAAADMVDRGEDAGDVVGLAEAGRDRRAEADLCRRSAQHRDQRGRLEAAQERGMVARIHDQPVRHEHQVELAAFGGARNLLDHRQLVVAGRGALVAPAGGVVAGAQHKHAEMHLTLARTHRACPPIDDPPPFPRPAPRRWPGLARLAKAGSSRP